jgi:hypothetical protein
MRLKAPSPLHRSESCAWRGIGALLSLLALVTAVAAVLIFTIDEAPNPAQRGAAMLGITALVGALSGACFLQAGRPSSAPHARPPDLAAPPPSGGWHRRRLGPAWTDWLVAAFPVALVAAPILLARSAPLGKSDLAALGLIVGLLELVIVPVLMLGRREYVELRLDPEGLRVKRRSGAGELIRPGELSAVLLETQTSRGISFGTLVLRRTTGDSIAFREPMSAPLPEIAHACTAHMRRSLA